MSAQPDEKKRQAESDPKEKRGLPLPRPAGQPEQEDAVTGDEGGMGFYGPAREEDEERGTD